MAYPYKGVAPALNTLLDQLNALAPKRSKLSDGALGDQAHAARVSFHNPDANGIVRARDFTHDPTGGLDCNWLANALTASGDPRILEIIWNRRYWTPRGGWVPYTGTNPHDKHLHLSVNGAPLYNSTAPWNLGANPEEDDMTPAQEQLLKDVHHMLVPKGGYSGPPGDVITKVGALQSVTGAVQAGMAALLARDPSVEIDAEDLAAIVPDDIAQRVVDLLGARISS